MTAEKYFNDEYDVNHISGIVSMRDLDSLNSCMEEFAEAYHQHKLKELLPSDEFDKIKSDLQESTEGYNLKPNHELIDMICEFGCGELDFETVDIERLIKENEWLKDKILKV